MRLHEKIAWALGGAAVAAFGAWIVAGLASPGSNAWALDAIRPGASDGPPEVAIAATPMGESDVILCLVDLRRHRLAVYQADARRNRLKLLAVRDISADWMLSDYNNDPPLPKDIRARVERMTESPQGPPTP